MKKRDSLLSRLESWAQEETGAQMRLLELLRTLERSLCDADHDVLSGLLPRLQEAGRERESRDRRRQALFAQFGKHWDVDPAALSVGSIAERLGEHGVRLVRLRAGLREVAQDVQRQARKVTVLCRHNHALLTELVDVLVGSGGEGRPEGSARLVDARV